MLNATLSRSRRRCRHWWSTIALLLVAGQSWALESRVQVDFEAMQRQPRDEPLRLRPPDSPDQALDTRLAIELSGQGLYARPLFRQDGSDPGQITVPELYYDASAGPLELSLGRKALQWDYGFLAAPVSWLGPPDNNDDDYHADPIVLAEYYRGLQVWQAGCTLRLVEEDELCLVRTEGFAGPADWQVLAGYEAGWRLGGGINWIATQRLAIRTSVAWAQNSTYQSFAPADAESVYLSQDPIIEETMTRWSALLGTTLALESGWEFMLEHAWDNAALSASDWRAIAQRVDDLMLTNEPAPGARAESLGWLAGAAATDPLVQHRSLARVTQSWNDWSAEGQVTLMWTDDKPTWISDIGPNLRWTDQASLHARWRHYDPKGVLADLGNEFRLTLKVRSAGL